MHLHRVAPQPLLSTIIAVQTGLHVLIVHFCTGNAMAPIPGAVVCLDRLAGCSLTQALVVKSTFSLTCRQPLRPWIVTAWESWHAQRAPWLLSSTSVQRYKSWALLFAWPQLLHGLLLYICCLLCSMGLAGLHMSGFA